MFSETLHPQPPYSHDEAVHLMRAKEDCVDAAPVPTAASTAPIPKQQATSTAFTTIASESKTDEPATARPEAAPRIVVWHPSGSPAPAPTPPPPTHIAVIEPNHAVTPPVTQPSKSLPTSPESTSTERAPRQILQDVHERWQRKPRELHLSNMRPDEKMAALEGLFGRTGLALQVFEKLSQVSDQAEFAC